jgi:transposase
MTGRDPEKVRALADETGVHQTTLSRWLRQAGIDTIPYMSHDTKPSGNTPRRPRDWSLQEKLQVLQEASTLSDQELGGYLRRKGLHEAQLEQWRASVAEVLGNPKPKPKMSKEHRMDKKRIQELERELRRKDKALAETAALLVLKKKVQAIWGDEDDDTDGKSGK